MKLAAAILIASLYLAVLGSSEQEPMEDNASIASARSFYYYPQMNYFNPSNPQFNYYPNRYYPNTDFKSPHMQAALIPYPYPGLAMPIQPMMYPPFAPMYDMATTDQEDFKKLEVLKDGIAENPALVPSIEDPSLYPQRIFTTNFFSLLSSFTYTTSTTTKTFVFPSWGK